MNIPADFPSPDQENVYYGVKSLTLKLSSYFENSSILKVKALVENFYLPVFVFDDNNSPNSYQIDVYPRGEKKSNILLDSNGAIISNSKLAIAAIPLTTDDQLKDGGSKTTIDSSFYSNSKLKSKDLFVDLPIDEESQLGMELLAASRFWMNEDVKKTIMSRNQYLELIKSTVKNAFSSLPEAELEIIKNVYDQKKEDVDQVIKVVGDIKTGQENTLDSIKFAHLAEKVYPLLSGVSSGLDEKSELKLTKVNIANSLVQLNNSEGNTYGRFAQASQITAVPTSIETSMPVLKYDGNAFKLSKVWNSFLTKCIENEYIQSPKLDSLIAGPISNASEILDPILSFSKEGAKKDTFVEENNNSSWINEWYYNNFAKILTGQETDFSGLESFIDGYQSTLNSVEKTAKVNTLGGSFLLVKQAILKSILKLCQSNIDVSSVAPSMGSTSIFTNMGRSSVLGPSGCHQYPSKYDQAEDEYSIANFSNTGFLCYQALLQIIRKIRNYSASRQFVISNISEYDSDHDKVLQLWDDLSMSSINSKQSVGINLSLDFSGLEMERRTGPSDKEVAHLYAKNEDFEGREIYLLPAGDSNVQKSERTFVNFNLPSVDHIKESHYLVLNSILELEGLNPLSDDDASLVDGSGKLSTLNATAAYNKMGYTVAFTQVSFDGDTDDSNTPTPYSRNSRVHYGIINDDNWNSDEVDNDVFEFFKQKNYNLPYFWASITSIYKSITVEVYKELINSVNDMLDTEVEIEIDDLLAVFDHDTLWSAIEETVDSLVGMNGLQSKSYVRPDGCITFTDDISGQASIRRARKTEYRNTAGDNTSILVRNYIKFTSLVSEHSAVKIVEEHEPITYSYSDFLPSEVLATNANTNYSNVHGGSGSYISDSFEKYYDPLEFKALEYKSVNAIKKNTTAVGIENIFANSYASYINQASGMQQHILLNKEVIAAFNKFKSFIDGFSIPDTAVHIFSSGNIDIKKDIKNPQKMIDQITSNKGFYSADAQGISEKWDNIKIKDVESFTSDSASWLYVYILGIDSSTFTGDSVRVVPTYIGSNGKEIPLTSETKSFWEFEFNKPKKDSTTLLSDEKESNLALNYMHLVRGMDFSETIFSYKSDRIYEEHIIESESGVFPWAADSFEEGIPKEPIDPIFNMSPWVYPTNYFYDVCISNEFKRVVACVIKEEHVNNLDIDSMSVGSIQEIIGSVRWKVIQK